MRRPAGDVRINGLFGVLELVRSTTAREPVTQAYLGLMKTLLNGLIERGVTAMTPRDRFS